MLKGENVLLNIKAGDKYEAIKSIIYNSKINEDIKDEFFNVVKKREEVQSTSVGKGIGIAHGRVENIENLEILMGIVAGGVNYDSYDGKNVHIIFVILTKINRNEEYLCTLSKLSKICRDDRLKETILKEDNKDRIVELINSRLGFCQ